MDALRDILEQQVALPEADWQALKAAWVHPRKLKRQEFLSKIGRKEHYLYWVVEGCFKIGYWQEDQERCVGFGYPNTFLCSFASFVSDKTSMYYIQTIRSAKVIGIAKQDFYQILEQSRPIERAWRQLIEMALLGRMEREIDLATRPPKERFLRLWERSPHLFQLIPQKYLASYLQMSPETFSRIKHKVWKP